MKQLIIIGAGGHGRSVAEAVCMLTEFEIAGFLDDNWPQNTNVWSYPILGNTIEIDRYRGIADWAIVAIGDNKRRAELHQKLKSSGFNLPVIKHPSSIIAPSAIIGEGTAIMAGAIVGTESKLGCGVILNSGAIVDHHCEVGDFGHLGVNTCMAGGSELGEGAWLHPGSSLGYRVKIPAWKIVASGATESNAP